MSYLQRTPEPGEIRLWTYQSIAHGADQLLYFTWRTCPFGSEQHWHGLIDADGRETRRLAEAAATAREIATLPDAFLDAEPAKVVAILRDFDVDVNERRINTYTGDGRYAYSRWAAAFVKRHVPTNFVWPDDDFDRYQILIAGHQKIVDDALVAKLTAFVERGGTLVLGAECGTHDRNLHMLQTTSPLATLAGVEIEGWTTLVKGDSRRLVAEPGGTADACAFVEQLRLTTASALNKWQADGSFDQAIAGTLRQVCVGSERGRVFYFGGYFDQANTDKLAGGIAQVVKGLSSIEASEHVECVVRASSDTRLFTLLNHSVTEQTVNDLPPSAMSLVGPSPSYGSLTLPPFGVAIVATTA